MSALLILIVAIVLLALGYVFYGSWLAKQWGVDPNRETPAHTSYDGKDFVPANPAVLMGHHFSSIAGAGPINGPIQAAVFGWVPVFLWCRPRWYLLRCHARLWRPVRLHPPQRRLCR